MLCPFRKIVIKLDAFGNEVTKDTETVTIKEIFDECSTDCVYWDRLKGICMF